MVKIIVFNFFKFFNFNKFHNDVLSFEKKFTLFSFFILSMFNSSYNLIIEHKFNYILYSISYILAGLNLIIIFIYIILIFDNFGCYYTLYNVLTYININTNSTKINFILADNIYYRLLESKLFNLLVFTWRNILII